MMESIWDALLGVGPVVAFFVGWRLGVSNAKEHGLLWRGRAEETNTQRLQLLTRLGVCTECEGLGKIHMVHGNYFQTCRTCKGKDSRG